MKIALLLTGQVRTHELTKYIIKNSIINQYDTDVFLTIDSNNICQTENLNSKNKTSKEIIDNLISFYNPIDFFVDNEFTEIETNHMFYASYRQYFFVMQCYLRLDKYIKQTNTKYDLIIRLRFDQILWNNNNFYINNFITDSKNNIIYNSDNIAIAKEISEKIKIIFNDDINDNEIIILGFGEISNYNYVNDQFWIHKPNLSYIIFTFYFKLNEIINNCKKTIFPSEGASIEHFFYKHLINNNIKYFTKNINGIFIREFYK